MKLKLPNESRLSRIPTPVLVGTWLLAIVLTAGCLFWALFAPSGGDQTAAVSPSPTRTARAKAVSGPGLAPTLTSKVSTPALSGTIAPPAPTPTGPTPKPKPTTVPTILPMDEKFGYGIQVNGLNDSEAPENSVNMVNKLKMTWIKQQIKWALFEPEPGKLNEEQLAVLDLLVKTANGAKVKLMLSIIGAPKWSHPGIDDIEAPPDDPNTYADFVGRLIDRYKSKGRAIHAIEVWNEQNLSREWHTNPQKIDAARYVQLLGPAYKTIKAKDPNIIVISGALSPTGCDDGVDCLDDFRYLEQMVNAGLLNSADCVGVHHNGYNIGPEVTAQTAMQHPKAVSAQFKGPFTPFNGGLPHHSWFFYDTLQNYAKIVGGRKPLCITEFGWASSEGVGVPVRSGFEFAQDNTLQDQANYIVQAFQLMRQWGFVKIAFLWNLNFNGLNDPASSDNVPYAILDSNGMPRPAFDKLEGMPKS